ncbi:MAG: MMPL family transporter [Candidatus Bipolaricaulia bacterium]
MIERFLRFVYRVIRHRAWWVLLGVFLLAIIAIVYTFIVSELKVRSSFLDLLPRHDRLIERFEGSQEALERIDYLQILIQLKAPPPEEAERERLLLDASSRVIAQLLKSPEIIEASDRPDVALPEVMILAPGGREWLQELLGYIERIGERLQGGGNGKVLTGGEHLSELYGQVNDLLKKTLAGGGGLGGGELSPAKLNQDLLGLLGLTSGMGRTIATLEHPEGLEGDIADLIAALDKLQQEVEKQIFFSHDKTAILINARPRLSSQAGVAYARKALRAAREAIAAAGLAPGRFEVGLSGSYAFTTESDNLIKRDMRNTTIISSLGVALIFILAFGRLFFPLLATIPLFLAMLLTLAWAKLAAGGLNLITTFVPSLIMGLGIDYGVHFLSRYLEERERGGHIGPSLKETLLKKGRATIIAGVTTAIVLLSLLFARSRGLFEMGVISGMGILFSLLLTIFVLPALIIVSHLVLRRSFRHRRLSYRFRPERAVGWLLKRKRIIVLAALLLSLALLYPASRVKFQFVSQNLVPQRMKSQLVRQKINEAGFKQLKLGDYFVFFARDEEELKRISSQLKGVDLVESVDSLADYLSPELQAQGEELSLSKRIAAGQRELELVEGNLDERDKIRQEAERLIVNLSSLQALSTLYGQGEVAKTVNSLIQELVCLIDSLEGLDPEAISANIAVLQGQLAQLSSKVKELFPSGDPFAAAWAFLQSLFKTPAGEFVIYAKVDSEKIYQKRYYKPFIQEVSQISDDYFGAAMIQDRLEWYMERDFWVTTALSALLIVLLLLWNFRRRGERKFAFLALLPLLLGYLWMLAGMRLLGLEFNLTNVLISPLLIGLGVDNGVHILHRYLEDRKIGEATSSTATAILVTSATTMLVFGSLLLARTPGLRLLGVSALLGLGFTTIFSLVLLPALVALRD